MPCYPLDFSEETLVLKKNTNCSFGILDDTRRNGYYKNIFGVAMYNEGWEEVD